MPPAIPIATYRVQLTANFDFDAGGFGMFRNVMEALLENGENIAPEFQGKGPHGDVGRRALGRESV